MGRILIYITTGCTHCVRAKKIFDNKNVPYGLVNLVVEPQRRDEMIRASGGLWPHIGVHRTPVS